METGCLFLCLEVRKSNVFEAVKQSVTTRQAAEYYGVQVGRNGMACCPFHDDKHPSMKVDRRFHCFGCQADAQESEVRTFIKEIRRYSAIEELDEAMLNRLISRILIGEVKKVDGQKVQKVKIVYNFVGEIPEIAA